MYFYKGDFHTSKPEGIEFKSEMPGVSLVLTIKEGQRISSIKRYVESIPVIETIAKSSYSTQVLSLGTFWEDEYRIFCSCPDGFTHYNRIIRYIGYMEKQRIELKGRVNDPIGQFFTQVGNVSIKMIQKRGGVSLRGPDIIAPSRIMCGGKTYYFKYDMELSNPDAPKDRWYLRSLTFKGLTQSYSDVSALNDVLYNMGYDAA